MTQQTAKVIDFTAHRARRLDHSRLTAMIPHNFEQSSLVFAVPVLMPVVIAWLPIWSMAAFSTGAPDE